MFFLKKESETFASYKFYQALVQTQHGTTIKVLQSDRGGEYLDKEFILYLKNAGTVNKLTVHDTPQHNGVAERLNGTILKKVHALLHASG